MTKHQNYIIKVLVRELSIKTRNADVPLFCLFNRLSSPSKPLCCLMGNCCSGTSTVHPSSSPPCPVAGAGSATTALGPSPPETEDVSTPSYQPRSRTTSVPKPMLHSGMSSQDSNPRSRAASAPQPPRSKSSTQHARTRPQPVAAPNRNRFDHRTSGLGESDD